MGTTVENSVADRLIDMVKKDLGKGLSSSANIMALMDLVVGVNGYIISNHSRQGVIRRVFTKERSQAIHGSVINIGVDIDDAVSIFWTEVFSSIDKVKSTGEEVDVRSVGGDGASASKRNTNCNPVHYLRMRGIMGVRNLINASYRKHLIQTCDDCNAIGSISSKESSNVCVCGSSNTERYWPDGTSTFRAKKHRRCLDCGKVWKRVFMYTCGQCKSTNVTIVPRTARVHMSTADANKLVVDETQFSDTYHAETVKHMSEVVLGIKRMIPIDPGTNAASKTGAIYSYMFDDADSAAICKLCADRASVVTDDDGNTKPDPKSCCGAKVFSLDVCTNYAKKIGQYQQCSASLSSRRVEKIREYAVKYIVANKSRNSFCESLYEELGKMDVIQRYK